MQSLNRHRNAALLVTLVVLILAGPIIHVLWGGARPLVASLLNTLAFSLVLLAGVFTGGSREKAWYAAILCASGTIAFQVAYSLREVQLLYVAGLLSALMFVCLTVVRALSDILSAKRVSAETIAASLCVYLLLAIGWSIAYSLLDYTIPEAFSVSTSSSGESARMLFGTGEASEAIYYSLVTITTLGYGDVSPVSPLARALAGIEALVGQLYIAVLIARLVALEITHRIVDEKTTAGE